jgi:zinc transporter ZupT
LFVLLYSLVINLQQANTSSKALVIASVWTGIVHVALGVLGTFVLKRFPTNFSVGFFLGVLVVLFNQNLILFGTFHGYPHGSSRTNTTFANIGLTLFAVLAFFSLLLFHFKKYIVVAPIDAKGLGSRSSDYQQYEERPEQ